MQRSHLLVRIKPILRSSLEGFHHLRLTRGHVRHIHVVRGTPERVNFSFFKWLKLEHPHLSRLFRHTTAFSPLSDVSADVALFLPWVQDPVRERDEALYRRLRLLEGKYEQEGVPVVNTIDSLSNSIKSRALEIIGRTGVRTARAAQVDEAWSYDAIVSRVGSPFIIRNDQGHGGYVGLIRSPEEFRGIAWGRLSQPLALEFIDTRSEDGLYRKYRYILMGDAGLFRHLLITTSWCAHARDRVRGDAYIKEEMDVMDQACPYHDQLNTARKALGMDYVAFDYSVDRQGGLVVWEPNPFPTLWSRHSARDSYAGYQKAHVGRVCTHLLGYYLNQAGIPVDT